MARHDTAYGQIQMLKLDAFGQWRTHYWHLPVSDIQMNEWISQHIYISVAEQELQSYPPNVILVPVFLPWPFEAWARPDPWGLVVESGAKLLAAGPLSPIRPALADHYRPLTPPIAADLEILWPNHLDVLTHINLYTCPLFLFLTHQLRGQNVHLLPLQMPRWRDNNKAVPHI